MEYYVGIDIGGMTIKGIVLDSKGKALCEDVAVTGSEHGGDAMCDVIAELVNSMVNKCGNNLRQIRKICALRPGERQPRP